MQVEEIIHKKEPGPMWDQMATCHGIGAMQAVGNGVNSDVYGSNDLPYVVKIVRGGDPGYMGWVDSVTDLGNGNPYLPKIYRTFKHTWEGETETDYDVFYIEKLQSGNTNSGTDKRTKERHVRRFATTLRFIMLDAQAGGDDWKKLRPIHQELIVLLLIAREQGGEYVRFDLHSGNVMRRGNRFVVIDPLF